MLWRKPTIITLRMQMKKLLLAPVFIVPLALFFAVNSRASESRTKALIAAVKAGDGAKVKMLVAKGADVNTQRAGIPLTRIAASKGNVQLLALLAKLGAKEDLESQLLLLAKFGHLTKIKELLKRGANVNVRDEDGDAPLMWATEGGQDVVIKVLLQHGAKVNAKGSFQRTPLIEAADRGFLSTVELLLKSGADVNLRDGDGKTALDYAKERDLPQHMMNEPIGKAQKVRLSIIKLLADAARRQ